MNKSVSPVKQKNHAESIENLARKIRLVDSIVYAHHKSSISAARRQIRGVAAELSKSYIENRTSYIGRSRLPPAVL